MENNITQTKYYLFTFISNANTVKHQYINIPFNTISTASVYFNKKFVSHLLVETKNSKINSLKLLLQFIANFL